MRSANNKSHLSFVHVSPSGLRVSLTVRVKSTERISSKIVSSDEVARSDVARKREINIKELKGVLIN